jgi:hypothetical protein
MWIHAWTVDRLEVELEGPLISYSSHSNGKMRIIDNTNYDEAIGLLMFIYTTKISGNL